MSEEHGAVEAGRKEYGDAVVRHGRLAIRDSRFAIRD